MEWRMWVSRGSVLVSAWWEFIGCGVSIELGAVEIRRTVRRRRRTHGKEKRRGCMCNISLYVELRGSHGSQDDREVVV